MISVISTKHKYSGAYRCFYLLSMKKANMTENSYIIQLLKIYKYAIYCLKLEIFKAGLIVTSL